MNAYALTMDSTAGLTSRLGRRTGLSPPWRQRPDRANTVADSLRAALNVRGFGVLIVDSAAKLMAVNRAAEALLKGAAMSALALAST
jgi:hypothetical protein